MLVKHITQEALNTRHKIEKTPIPFILINLACRQV